MSSYYRDQRGNGRTGGQQNRPPKYVGAPYNFVPFGTRVLEVKEEQMQNRATLNEELLSGEIEYKVTAVSEIYIGTGKDDAGREKGFAKNEYGRYIIPGSSMRGLIRANTQILGMADVGDDIDDYKLMYRSVGGRRSKLKKTYEDTLGAKAIKVGENRQNTISVILYVKAGYIVKRGSRYVIYPAKGEPISRERGEMNYYILSELDVQKNIKEYPLFENHPEYAMHDLKRPFVKGTDRTGRTIYTGIENRRYKAGYHRISYSISGNGKVVGLDEPGKLAHEGFLMSTGPMRNKKVHYIIPEIDLDEGKAIDISEKDQRAFQIDFESKKNTLGANKAFFSLPENDQPKPVFYIYRGGRLYFGFTPRLRLFYANSVKKGLRTDNVRFDFAKALFGMSKDNESYRSKVSFSDMLLMNQVGEGASKKVILASPKPTSYWDYLVQDGENEAEAITYNDKFRLRGIKQYWLRDNIPPMEDACDKNEKVSSSLRPLNAGAEFKGKVRFQNLTEAELGLLVWAIYVDKNARLNIGMGKPFGYGVIRISDIKVRKFDLGAAYAYEGGLNLDPFSELSVQDLITGYKEYVRNNYPIDIDEQLSVKDFILMKTRVPAAHKIRYMSIDNREYQNRARALDRVEDVLDIRQQKHVKGKTGKKARTASDYKDKESAVKGFTNKDRSVSDVKRETPKPEIGKVYTATVQKWDSNRLKFAAQVNGGNCYSNQKFSNAEKKNLKDKYTEGMTIKVQFNGEAEGDTGWKIVLG